MSRPEFVWPVRVYWEDTDAGGVVYHANYLRFLERARTEWLRALGIDQSALKSRTGVVLVIHRLCCDFLAPAKLDDQLEIEVAPVKLGAASMQLAQSIRRQDGVVMMRAEVRAASLRVASWRPCRLPGVLIKALELPSNGHN